MKINHKTNENESIFHFTKMNTALEFILPHLTLKLNLLENTNDPRENKRFSLGAKNGKFYEGEEIKEQIDWNERISQKIRNNTKVLCFSTDYTIANEPFDGYNLPRMWAQYGQNHLGICLDIDLHLFKTENQALLEQCYLDRVNYYSRFDYPLVDYDALRSNGIENYANEFRRAYIDQLFFSKFIDWESEREFRIVHFDNSTDDIFLNIKNSLRRIILGIDFKDTYLPSVIRLANGIPIEKIDFLNNNMVARRFREDHLQEITRKEGN